MAGGRRGRPPKPTHLKVLEGNPGKRPLNKKEPKPDKAIPTCPTHLSKEAKVEWRRISKILFDLGLLTNVDRAALAMYCQTYGRWVQAEKQIKDNNLVIKTKTGYPIQNPYISVSNQAMTKMRGFLAEFGMTPASRSRVATEEDEDDPMEAFLNRGKDK